MTQPKCEWRDLRSGWRWPLPLCPHRELLHAVAASLLLLATALHLFRTYKRAQRNRKTHHTDTIRHKGEQRERRRVRLEGGKARRETRRVRLEGRSRARGALRLAFF